MSVNMFETRTMLRALEQMKAARKFLLDTFFKGIEVHDTLNVDIDIIKGTRRMASFVHPRSDGKLVERGGYQTKTYKPPYIKEIIPTEAANLMLRAAGETIYQQNVGLPAQRAARQLGLDLAELDDMITRREEWMAAQALFTGQITVIGDGVDDMIDFGYESDHKVVLTGTARWDQVADTDKSDPLTDFRHWRRRVIQDSGISPDTVVMGSEAIDAYLNHPKVQGVLDNRRIDMGQIDPRALPDGVTYYGHIKEGGLDVYGYDEWYLDENGDEQPMVPPKKLLLGSTNARTARHYGMIQDMDAEANFAVSRYPKSWTEKRSGVRMLMMQSAPLVVPHQIDAFMWAQVIADE